MSLYLICACAIAGLTCLVLALRTPRAPASVAVDPQMAEQLQKIRATRARL